MAFKINAPELGKYYTSDEQNQLNLQYLIDGKRYRFVKVAASGADINFIVGSLLTIKNDGTCVLGIVQDGTPTSTELLGINGVATFKVTVPDGSTYYMMVQDGGPAKIRIKDGSLTSTPVAGNKCIAITNAGIADFSATLFNTVATNTAITQAGMETLSNHKVQFVDVGQTALTGDGTLVTKNTKKYITGTGTKFLSELIPGQQVLVGSNVYTVDYINTDLEFFATTAAGADASTLAGKNLLVKGYINW